MPAKYLVEITDPQQHYVRVTINLSRSKAQDKLSFFLPSWSPGSYLMREYAKHVRKLEVESSTGKKLYFEKLEKGIWEIDWSHSEFKNEEEGFVLRYEVYCHELTVRTSHIDISHAFLHGPSYLMGSNDLDLGKPVIEFRFPDLWSKLTTGLKDISDKREVFLYEAESYDDLLDCPVEIGCHITDGFMVKGKPHHLAFYGEAYPHGRELKNDIQKIVEYVSSVMDDGDRLPYDEYTFMTHLKKDLFGGLEHSNSTALQFDGRKFLSRKSYLQWLALVAHEYFHTWNVKRIRPIELGPFDYTNENYSRMLWLVEGLTSFVDELFVYQAGLCTLEEYFDMQKMNFSRYFDTPGRRFDSLEESSYDAWIKLYRPHENSRNSTMSYYLKGGMVFSILNIMFQEKGESLQSFIRDLWLGFQKRVEVGVTKEEVLSLIEARIGAKLTASFEGMLSTTQEVDYEAYYNKIGVKFKWENKLEPSLGATVVNEDGKAMVKSIVLDSAAYKYGLNAGDEIIALNHTRVGAAELNKLKDFVIVGKEYVFTISRLGKLMELPIVFELKGRTFAGFEISDRKLVEKALKF